MGKGEIARNEQFLLFPQCFQKICFPEASKGVTVWEWVNINALQYKTGPIYKSDNHIFAKIPGVGGIQSLVPSSGSVHDDITLFFSRKCYYSYRML